MVQGLPDHDIRRGALYVISAALAFSTMAALIKVLSTDINNEMLVWARNVFSLIFLTPLLIRYKPHQFLTSHWRSHLLRTGAGLLAMYCLFWSIPRLHLAEALLLNHTATLFIPFIAMFWLKESFGRRTGIAIIVGFIGIMMVLKPGASVFSWAALVGLTSGVLAAVAMVSIRSMAGVEPSTRIVLYFSVFGTLASSIPLAWAWQTPNWWQWCLLAVLGLLAMGGQLLLTRAYMSAPAAQVGPFTYASVVFGAILGWMFWGETLDRWSWAGTGLVIAAGVLIVFRWPIPKRPVLY